MKSQLFILSLFVLIGLPGVAGQVSLEPKRTHIEFDEQVIRGQVNEPDVIPVNAAKRFNFAKLVKMRENFAPEMSRTAEEIGK